MFSSQTDMHINNLELEDNHLLAEGARYMVEMLKANFTIQHLVCLREGLCYVCLFICESLEN